MRGLSMRWHVVSRQGIDWCHSQTLVSVGIRSQIGLRDISVSWPNGFIRRYDASQACVERTSDSGPDKRGLDRKLISRKLPDLIQVT